MRFTFLIGLLLAFTGLFAQAEKNDFKNGDLIFIVNPSGQGKAIQLATHLRFTHVGIVFMEDGKPIVYHAVEPVMKSSLQEFLAMSADKTYEVRRLKDQGLLSEGKIAEMKTAAKKELGKHYDLGFSWDDERLYCSEYVWKLYQRSLTISIGALKPLRSFDLRHPAVQAKMRERYGATIPLDEQMISPGDMYNSPLLESAR